MQGGARVRSGPPPDPNALRRDRDKAEWVTLPAAGREGDAPEWPLSRASRRELDLWRSEWRRPQAVMWEINNQQVEVALFVRALAVAEKPDAVVSARLLVRQQMDSLGLTIPGLRSHRWRIDSPSPAPEPVRTHDPDRASAKSRFAVLEGGDPPAS